jgi:hypothetical protein
VLIVFRFMNAGDAIRKFLEFPNVVVTSVVPYFACLCV